MLCVSTGESRLSQLDGNAAVMADGVVAKIAGGGAEPAAGSGCTVHWYV